MQRCLAAARLLLTVNVDGTVITSVIAARQLIEHNNLYHPLDSLLFH